MKLTTALTLILLCLASTAHAAPDCVSPVFNVPSEYGAGAGPTSVASADFNGDGIKDLAVPNNVSNNVSILLGDGTGGFGPPANYTVSQLPSSVAVADFDKDGDVDLAVGHGFGGGPLSVLFNDGTGKFSAPTVITTNNPTRVAVGDFNGDTNPDIAVNNFTTTARILLGDGAGHFTAKVFNVGGETRVMTVGDFNGDHVSDLAFGTGFFPNEVVTVLGNAAGTFAVSANRIPLDQTPVAITAGDLNGDGKDEIAVNVYHFEPRLEVLLNDGSGNFTALPYYVVTQDPNALAISDFNGDGKADIAVGGGNTQIFVGNGTGFFTTNQTRYLTGGGGSLLVGDFNSDGKQDLVSPRQRVGIQTGVVAVVFGNGDGTFDTSRGHNYGFSVFPGPHAVGDFNGDGKADVASAFAYSTAAGITLGDGAGGLVSDQFFYGAQNYPVGVAVGDFDADGKLDVATVNNYAGTVTAFYGDGAGGFRNSSTFPGAGTGIVSGNFNGDNKTDLAVSNDTGRVTVLLSTGVGAFAVAPGSPFELAPGSSYGSSPLAVGDFNGDGKDDLAAANSPQNAAFILLNDGTGRMTQSSSTAIPVTSGYFEVHLVAADLNHDGRTDLVSADGEKRAVTVFLGDGAGGLGMGVNFDSGVSSFLSYRATFLAVADFNGDTHPDLAVSNNDFSFVGDVSVLFGDGAGSFGAPVSHFVGGNPFTIAVGNFNADSKPDLAVISGGTVFVLLNTYEQLPCVSVGDVAVTEGDAGTQNAVFNVTLSQASAKVVRVNYSLKALTATAGTDYTNVAGRLAFAPGETSKQVAVPVAGDALDESDETFEFDLASPSNAALSDAAALGTISDNDPTPTLSVNDATVTEGNFFGDTGGSVKFTVQLSAPSGRDVTFKYSTADGTATATTFSEIKDYQGASGGTATIQAGKTSADIVVFVTRDIIYETDETFFLNLSEPVNAAISDGQGVATLVNDDTVPIISVEGGFLQPEGSSGPVPMSFTVRLSNPTYQTVTVKYATSDGTATAGTDYVAASGTVTVAPEQDTQTFNVTVNGDTLDETLEIFNVTISDPVNATLGVGNASAFIFDDDGPAISVSDVTVAEGNDGTVDAAFTVSLSAASPESVSVNFATANGTAASGTDYQQRTSSLTFAPGTSSLTVIVRVNGDTAVETDETFFLNISNPVRSTIADAQGVGTILDDDESHVQFASASYSAGEGDGKVLINLTRTGDSSGAFTFDYATAPGTASERSDYTTALGTVRFAAGETQKSVTVLVANDAFAEGAETFNVTLSNASGGKLRGALSAAVTIVDNDGANGPSPVGDTAFDTEFFVRQHYADFLSREADAPGLAFWKNEIESCGANAQCREVRKINVSAAFFLSIEFQETGYLAYRTYKAAYGDATSPNVAGAVPVIRLGEFLSDAQRIGRDVVVGQGNWQALLEANKQAYALEFVQRQRFTDAFPLTLTPAQFVDKLNTNAGGVLSDAERTSLVGELTANNTNAGRASVLRKVAEDSDLRNNEKNRAFVLMQYYGYMRRNPDDPQDTDFRGWKFWLGKLEQFNGNFVAAEMVKAFITSDEYRHRFGQ